MVSNKTRFLLNIFKRKLLLENLGVTKINLTFNYFLKIYNNLLFAKHYWI